MSSVTQPRAGGSDVLPCRVNCLPIQCRSAQRNTNSYPEQTASFANCIVITKHQGLGYSPVGEMLALGPAVPE